MFSLETKSLFFYLEPLTILQAFSWMQTTCPAILSEVTSCRSWSAAHLSDTPTSCSVWCGAFRENLISFLLQLHFICTFLFDWRIFPKSVRCHQSPLRQFCSLVSRRLSALYTGRRPGQVTVEGDTPTEAVRVVQHEDAVSPLNVPQPHRGVVGGGGGYVDLQLYPRHAPVVSRHVV